MRSEKREVFVADDGKVFETAELCIAHEKEVAALQKRIEGLRVFTVRHSFDSTEGRGYGAITYLVTDASHPVIIDYCFSRYGAPLSGWYGTGFYEVWCLHEQKMTADEALTRSKDRHSGVGDTRATVDLVFLSEKDIDHPGLPKRVFPWPRPAKTTKAA